MEHPLFSGAVVYQLKGETAAKNEHYLCPNCFTGSVKSILQADKEAWKVCPTCRWGFYFGNAGPHVDGATRNPNAPNNGKLLTEIAALKTQKAASEKGAENWKGRYELSQHQLAGLIVRHEQEKQAVQNQLNALTAKLDAALPKKLDEIETALFRSIALAADGIGVDDLAHDHSLHRTLVGHHLDKLAGQNLIALGSKMHEELRLGSYAVASLTPTGRTVAVKMKFFSKEEPPPGKDSMDDPAFR